MELKAKYPAGLLMYWVALNSCTRRKRKKEGRKRERERKREEADELGPLELKAKLIPGWAASILDCLQHLHQPRRKRDKKGRERERERERRGT